MCKYCEDPVSRLVTGAPWNIILYDPSCHECKRRELTPVFIKPRKPKRPIYRKRRVK